MYELLSNQEIEQELRSLDSAWSGSVEFLHREIKFDSFLDAVRFVDLLALECEAINHHPDMSISWRTVTLSLKTHSAGGVTSADIGLAEIIDRAAQEGLVQPS